MRPRTIGGCGIAMLPAALLLAAQDVGNDPFPRSNAAAEGLSAEALDRLVATIRAWCEEDRVVGAELLVIKNRRTVLHTAQGWRDREAGLAMETQTIFNLRSMTKPLVGAAAQIWIDEGELSLEDRVADFFPEFDHGAAAEITIGQLLTHQSGLPLSVLVTGTRDYPDLRAQVAEVGRRGPEFPPGQKFWYSDAGSDTLAAIVAERSGETVDVFLRDRLLVPLGMLDTYTPTTEDDPRATRIASIYIGGPGSWARYWAPGGEPFYPFAWGSQSLYGTPRDYARFLALWLDAGRSSAGNTILSEEAVRRTLTKAVPMSSLGSDAPMPTGFPGMRVYYGQMAVLYVDDQAPSAPVRVFGHSGSDGTWAWAWPDEDLMVLYFTQSRGQATGLRVESLVDRWLVHPEATPVATPASYVPYVGCYRANFGPFVEQRFTVLAEAGHLVLDIPSQLFFDLDAPDAEGFWNFTAAPSIRVSFVRGNEGHVTTMRLHQSGQVFDLPRVLPGEEPAALPSDQRLASYLGFYRDEANGVDIELIARNGTLAARIPGRPAPLEFAAPDTEGFWTLKADPSLRIRFDRDEHGEVVSYTVHRDGRTSIRPRLRGPRDGS